MTHGLATTLAIPALCVNALLAISLAITNPHDESGDTKQQTERQEAVQECIGWIPCAASCGDPMAYYTCWLTWLTGGLVFLGLGQGVALFVAQRIANGSANAARDAANAAHLNATAAEITATAAIAAERAWFFPDGEMRLIKADGDAAASCPITNFGRTPGTVTEIWVKLYYTTGDPTDDNLKLLTYEPRTRGPGEHVDFLHYFVPEGDGIFDLEKILNDDPEVTGTIFLVGRILYSDVIEPTKTRTTGFCYEFVPKWQETKGKKPFYRVTRGGLNYST